MLFVTDLEFDTLFTQFLDLWPTPYFLSGQISSLSTGELLYVVGMNTDNDPDASNELLFLRLRSDGSPPDMRTYEGVFQRGAMWTRSRTVTE